MASPSDDTARFPVARDDTPPPGTPAHAAHSASADDTSGITRGGWWAITLTAAALLLVGLALTFGPARYWSPVPLVFLGYFFVSGLIGLVFWKGVRELRDSNPTLHTDQPASPAARVAAAIGAVGVASALILLPTGLNEAPANAFPCPDGSQTCGPNPGPGGPTGGPTGGNTTAPGAPNTTVPPAADTGLMQPPTQGQNTPTVQGNVPTMPTAQAGPNDCILNCGPTGVPQGPATGQANPPQTAQNPVTTAPNTPATTPRVPTTTPQLRTPTPETTTSTSSSKARDRDDERDEDEENSGIPYQAAWLSSVVGTYRRKKTTDSAVQAGQVVSKNVTRTLSNATAVSKPVQAGNPAIDSMSNYSRAVEYMWSEIEKNRSSSTVKKIQGQLEGDLLRAPDATEALMLWTQKVHKGGAWDHKHLLRDMFDMEEKGIYWFQLPWTEINGKHDLLFYDVFSNVHYGYVGRVAGIDEKSLMQAANLSFVPGVGSSDAGDDMAMKFGMELFERYGADMTASEFRGGMDELIKRLEAAGGLEKFTPLGTGGL